MFHFDASFVVLLSFITFMVIAYKLAYKKIFSELDGKILEVKKTLEESQEELRLAKKLAEGEKKRLDSVYEEVDVIMAKTKSETGRLKKKFSDEIDELTKTRQASFEGAQERLRRQTLQQLKASITKTTVKTLTKIAGEKCSDKDHEAINDNAIDLIEAELSSLAQKKSKKPLKSSKRTPKNSKLKTAS